MIQAANGAKQKKGSFYRAKYRKLQSRLGSANKAKVGIANRLARAIYKVMGTDRLISIGKVKSVLPLNLKVTILQTNRTESNPYGLIIGSIAQIVEKEKKE